MNLFRDGENGRSIVLRERTYKIAKLRTAIMHQLGEWLALARFRAFRLLCGTPARRARFEVTLTRFVRRIVPEALVVKLRFHASRENGTGSKVAS